MAFTFETNGNNSFLVYGIEPEDTLDTMTLGMITNNKIPGMASVVYTQMNADRFLKYNITAKVTVKQFFAGVVNRRRLLGVFSGITAAVSVAEEYMIDLNSFLLDTDFIYADVSTCNAEVICLPVMNVAGTTDVGMFFKNIMFLHILICLSNHFFIQFFAHCILWCSSIKHKSICSIHQSLFRTPQNLLTRKIYMTT